MIEKIMGLERISILQCQKVAEKFGFNSVTFDLVGPNGRIKAKWLDAYLGLFQIEGEEGFNLVNQFQFIPDLYCENIILTTN